MKKIYLMHLKSFNFITPIKFCLIVMLFVTSTLKAQTYCSAAATSTSDDEIFNVTLSTLNNTSACGALGGAGSVAFEYNNYTTTVPAPILTLGANYPLSLTIGMCGTFGYSGIAGVWIDYNHNGLFTDPGENVYMSPYQTFAITGTTITAAGGITIPLTATPGLTRMRVVEDESSTAPGPCTSPLWGEVEDYNVMLLSPSPLDLGVSAILKPTGTNKCFTVDTIVARITNYGSAIADFSVNPTVITVKAKGPSISTYTMALNSGTLATAATQDFTLTTLYNMTSIGTYKFKGYTTVTGDGSALNDTTQVTISRTPFFTTTISPNDSVCLGVPVQLNSTVSSLKQVGSGAIVNSSFSYPAPYGNYYEGAKHQFLFLASELTASGLTAGNITSLSLNATNLNGTNPLSNFAMAIATTTLTSLTNFATTSFTTFVSVPSYTPVLGINTHTLLTPFIWDGVSNIIINTCFNNTPSGFSSNVSFSQSSTAFSSSVWYSADATPSICSTTTTVNFMSQRPDFYFGQPAVVNYTWTTSGGLSATNISNPIANLTTSKTYTVSANIAGCTSYDTVHIFIKPTPTPNLGNDTTICIMPFALHANTAANSYLWNTGYTGTSINVTTSGKYWVRGTNTNGCVKTDTIKVSLGVFPIVTLGADTVYCSGSTVTLYCGNTGSTILWNTGATTPSIVVGTSGTYSVIVTNTVGCKSSDVINVTSKPKPTVGLVFTGPTHFCPTSTGRLLTEGTPVGGAYIGSGITASTFNANTAGQGTYIIVYSYTGPNGCSNIAKDTLFVDACVGIDELTSDLGLNVYPNPTTGEFTLEVNATADITGNINITTVDGRLVYQKEVNGNTFVSQTINISDLSNGIYYLRLDTKHSIKTYKVLKQ